MESLEKEYSELKKDDTYQILNNDENCFEVISVKDYRDDLSDCEEILRVFGLLNAEGNIRYKLKILKLKHNLVSTAKIFVCVLSGIWSETEVEAKDEVQIFGKFCPNFLAIHIKNNFDQETSIFHHNFIIVEPNFLLHPTAITSSLPCPRKSFLSSYVGGRDDISLPLLKGLNLF